MFGQKIMKHPAYIFLLAFEAISILAIVAGMISDVRSGIA